MMRLEEVKKKANAARAAAGVLSLASTVQKNRFLRALARRLPKETSSLLAANKRDLRQARRAGLSRVLVERLSLTPERIRQMVRGVEDVVRLPDPIGELIREEKRPNGLLIRKVRVPLGTVGIIYESRPNVTIDSAILCLKAGNSVVLRGGSEAIHSNKALVEVLKKALREAGLPQASVQFIDSTDRKAVAELLRQDDSLDVIIPRGSQKLIEYIRKNSAVPVIAHGEGNCHVYVDDSADLAGAEEIVFNAKVQRPSVCNAAEKLLVHRAIAARFLPRVALRLRHAHVELRGDADTRRILDGVVPASEEDWMKEYLDLILAIKIVDGVGEAISHINTYGSHHSDAIVTRSKEHGERFLREVDSAAVYVNASTRFTDGYEFGLGAEIGISTQKLHARGPMGLEELTSVKYVVRGTGQVRS